MNFAQIKKHWGAVQTAATALGKSRQAVYQWETQGVPIAEQYRIQVLTKGKLKADPEVKAK